MSVAFVHDTRRGAFYVNAPGSPFARVHIAVGVPPNANGSRGRFSLREAGLVIDFTLSHYGDAAQVVFRSVHRTVTG